jgi:hypothetical protein
VDEDKVMDMDKGHVCDNRYGHGHGHELGHGRGHGHGHRHRHVPKREVD